jgi:hypothetical protein
MNSKELLSALSNTNDSVCCELLRRRIKLDVETARIDLEIKKAEYEYREKLREMAISALESSDFKKLDYIKQIYDLDNKGVFIEPLKTKKTTTKKINDEPSSTVDENKSAEKNNNKASKPQQQTIKRLKKVKNTWNTRHLISSNVYNDKNCQTLYFGNCTNNLCEFKREHHMHSIVKAKYGLNMIFNNKNVVYFKSKAVKTDKDLKQLISSFKMTKY